MTITTTDFLASVKRNVTMPANQIRFTNADILAMADEQTQILMLPLITSLRQEFFVVKEDVTINSGQARYKIPYRATGRTLREIKIKGATDNSLVYTIPYVVPEDTQYFLNNNARGQVQGYTMRGDEIVLLPVPYPNPSQVMELYYELAPSKLVEVSDAGVITSCDYNTGIVVLEGAVTDFATGQTMDIIDGRSGNSVTAIDIVNTNVSSNNVTFDPADFPTAPNTVTAGDYLALSNESPVLQLPNEAHMVLVQATTVKLLEAQGDFEGMGIAEKKLAQGMEALAKLITPRVEANVPTINNINGLGRNSSFGRGRYFRYGI